MAGGEAIGAELLRGGEEVSELDRLIAADARDGRGAGEVSVGKILHHLLAEAGFVIEHIMGNADGIGHIARVVDVLPRAAGALLLDGGAVIVKLQRDADHVIAFGLQHRSHNGAVDAARHGRHNTGFMGGLGKSKRIDAASGPRSGIGRHLSLPPGSRPGAAGWFAGDITVLARKCEKKSISITIVI
jgi:hypothetical protein